VAQTVERRARRRAHHPTVAGGGQPYKGINVLMLWASAMNLNFVAPIWMTFNQAKELKANVMKGSKGSLVVYADRITKTETAEDGAESERDIYFMKGYTVFNVEQIEDSRRTSTLPPPRRSTRCNASKRLTCSSPTPGPTSDMAESGLLRRRSRLRADAALRVL